MVALEKKTDQVHWNVVFNQKLSKFKQTNKNKQNFIQWHSTYYRRKKFVALFFVFFKGTHNYIS